MKPSEIHDNGEIALECICRDCPRETGWLDEPGKIDTPECALRVIDDRDVLTAHGACSERIDLMERLTEAEREIYEKRMRGDWS